MSEKQLGSACSFLFTEQPKTFKDHLDDELKFGLAALEEAWQHNGCVLRSCLRHLIIE